MLARLGFQARLVAAEVFKEDGTTGPPFDHMAMIVGIGEEEYLADVGFGESFILPLKLSDERPQVEGRRTYQVVRNAVGFVLLSGNSADDGPIKPSFTFSMKPRRLSDFEEMCVYHQTSPLSHFTRKKICSLATENGRVTLTGNQVIETVHGVRDIVELASTEDRSRALEKHFGICL